MIEEKNKPETKTFLVVSIDNTTKDYFNDLVDCYTKKEAYENVTAIHDYDCRVLDIIEL